MDCAGKRLGLEHREPKHVERLLGVPAVLGTLQPDEKDAIGNRRSRFLVLSRTGLAVGVSCDHLLLRAGVAVELADQGIAVFLCGLGQVLDEALDLLAVRIPERRSAAEIDGVGLDQLGIELVLADDLAEPITDLVAGAIAVSIAVVAGEDLGRLRSGCARSRDRPDLLDRADADAVGLAQSPVDGAGLGDPHLGAAHQGRDVGRIGVAVADKPGGALRRVDGRFQHVAARRGITERFDRLDVDTAAVLAAG